MPEEYDLLFEESTPLGFSVRSTSAYWSVITEIKHPVMKDRLNAVRESLHDPDVICRSRSDYAVFLFYKRVGAYRWTCAVARRLNGTGFLVTAYLTDAIKAGEVLWTK